MNLRTRALVMICVSSQPSGAGSRCDDGPLLVGLLGYLLNHMEQLVAVGQHLGNVPVRCESAVS